MDAKLPDIAVAEHLANRIAAVGALPDAVRAKCEATLIDVVGLCIAARNEDYVKAALDRLGRRRTMHRDRPRANSERSRCRLCQRHRGARRGLRRHLRRRPGARRRGAGAGGARRLRTARRQFVRRSRGAERHRNRHRDHVPALDRGADQGAQGGLSSDRGVRRRRCGRRRCHRARPQQEADRRRARHRRLDGLGHHRISRRGHLDQAHARRLGGAVGVARRAVGPRRLFRAAHRVRGRARAVPWVRQHARRRLRRADRRFWRALGDADAGVQALSLRDHDASLHRLRAAAWRAPQV